MKSERKDFAYHLTKFFTVYLPSQRNLSQGTAIAYKDAFRLLLQFCNEKLGIKPTNLSLKDFDRKCVEDFILWLKDERHNKANTCNQRLAALNSFFTYLQYEQPDMILQCQQCMSIPYMKTPEPPLKYLTIDGIQAIMDQPDTSTKYGRRDLAILSLMYDTGARVQEISGVNLVDLRLISPATLRLTGKGNKTRVVPLLSKTSEILSYYIKDFKLKEQGDEVPLFQNRKHGRLSRFGISYILTYYADRAREHHPDLIPDRVSPHMFRHSKAMHLLQANVNIVYIRDLLGHESIKTTEVYARADNTLKRKALEKADPIKHKSLNFPDWNNDEDLMDWLRNLGK